MKRLFLSLICISAAALSLGAQDKVEPYMSVDLTSAYLWRGQRNAGPSIQPVAGLRWRGLNFYVWANEQLAPPAGEHPVKHEIDFFLKYAVTPDLTIGLKDVYVNNRGKGFFSFGSIPHAANGLDILLHYDLKYVNFEWTTTIAGYDGYTHGGRRAYGSYLIIAAPLHWLYVDWTPSIGIVPYYCSRYSDDDAGGFHVNMAAIKASHTFNFGRNNSMAVTPYMQLMVNPSARTAYFQVGARWEFQPMKLK